MKKILSVVLACALLVGCVFTLAACGKKLSGKYEADLALVEVTYDFKSSGKVAVTIEPLIGDSTTFEGKYEFNDEGDEFTVTFDSEEEDAEDYAGTHSFSEGEEDGEAYIKIDGVKYKKIG